MEKMVYMTNSGVKALPGFYGHIEDTEIFFENEKLYVTVLKTGEITFESELHAKLAEAVMTPDTKNGMHDSAYCKAASGKIYLYFSIVDYVDNYPHCDGEHDRWSEVCTGYDCLVYSLSDGTFERFKADSLN